MDPKQLHASVQSDGDGEKKGDRRALTLDVECGTDRSGDKKG